MSRTRVGRFLRQFGLLLVVVFILLFTQQGQATTTNNLNFFKNYFLTGDYVVAGVGLRGTGTAGIATGTIHFTGNNVVPPSADILAAFLYWETVITNNSGPGTAGAKFRDYDISAIAVELNPNGTAPCWSSGGGAGGAEGAHAMKAYRADVLQFLAQKQDGNGHPIGKRLVNDDDLTANNLLPLNTVKLPDAGTGNAVPSTAGASLFILYRDPSKPLTGVVIYDGGYTMDQSHQSLTLNVQGFFQAANGNAAAKMTHIVGDGQANFSEQVVFNGGVLATNPFQGFEGPVADPAWDSWTSPPFAVPTSVNPTATVEVNHGDFTPFDCLSWGAIIFSTPVLDTDGDGLLDAWETMSGLTNPDGEVLPDIHAMGANPYVQDLFVEIGYMTTTGYDTPLGQVTAHNHMPSDAVLNNIITTFHNAAARPNFPCPNGVVGSCPINLHLDVGTNYSGAIPNANQCANNWQPACGIIRPALARGGEAITETACVATLTHPCDFPDYPGTVGWKGGFQSLRDQPLNYPDEASCVAAGALCQRRFDSNRFHIFKYGLFVHALAIARSDVDDPLTPYDERHTPRTVSGVADGGTGGGDFMVSLGWWGNNFRGSDFVQWSTTVHEMGHTLSLRHGGPIPTLANPAPNCRPDYVSVMSYLFQVRGIITASGPTVDLSRQTLKNLNESSLTETAIVDVTNPNTPLPMLNPTRWFAPLSGSILDTLIGTTPASRHCNGTPLLASDPLTVRIDGTSTGPIDWNANGLFAPQDVSPIAQDINFNGYTGDSLKDGTFAGYNDWFNVDLRQTPSRPNGNKWSLEIEYSDLGDGAQVTYGDSIDVSYGDSADVSYGDSADVTFGDSADVTFGKDLDFDTATAVGNAPNRLRYTTTNQAIILNWDPPHAGSVTQYQVWRATGPITATNLPVKIFSTTQVVPPTTYSDTSSKNNVVYSYFVTTMVGGKQSGPSNIILASR